MNEQRYRWLRPSAWSTLVVMALLTGVAPAQALAAQFIPLGHLLGGDVFSAAYTVSDNGDTVFGVGQIGTDYDDRRLFRWTEAGGIEGPLSDSHVWVRDASADGSLAVGFYDGGWRWTAGTGLIPLARRKKKIIETSPDGVAADGSIIVGSKPEGRDRLAFRWTEATGIVNLGTLPGHNNSFARDVSSDGMVVVGQGYRRRKSSTPRIPIYWDGDTGPFAIPPPEGSEWSIGLADAVSPDGAVVTGWDEIDGVTTGFRWEIATGDMTIIGQESLSTPSTPQLTVPRDISHGGEFIVGFENTANGRDARIWDAGDAEDGAQDLQDFLVQKYDLGTELTGWDLRGATKISPNGLNIVGYGTNPFGNTEAFLVRLGGSPSVVPEPSALVLLFVGSTLLVASRVRRRRGRHSNTHSETTPQPRC